jgi:hypothetical protein
MTDEERKAWELWTIYCQKVEQYYDATDIQVTEKPELEPWGMNPPPGVIVTATLAADAELKHLEGTLQTAIDLLCESAADTPSYDFSARRAAFITGEIKRRTTSPR